jgi:hypothetical protein
MFLVKIFMALRQKVVIGVRCKILIDMINCFLTLSESKLIGISFFDINRAVTERTNEKNYFCLWLAPAGDYFPDWPACSLPGLRLVGLLQTKRLI